MKTTYKYFKKLNLADDWEEITPGEMEDFIDMKFAAAPRTDWTGNTLPSRAEAWNHLHEGHKHVQSRSDPGTRTRGNLPPPRM